MDNSPRLPIAALGGAGLLAVAALISYVNRGGGGVVHLSELEIGCVGWAFTLAIFGVQGLVSVALEGRRLRPGRVRPRLTNPLSWAIVLFSLLLFALAIALGSGIYHDWRPQVIGVLAGLGSLDLALLLVFYKEAFVGDEAGFDDREDGVPW